MKKLFLLLVLALSSISISANKTEDLNEYVWMEGNGDFYINFNNDNCNLEYSFDKTTWTKAVPTSARNFSSFTKVPANKKIYFKGVNGVNQSFWGYDWWGCIRTTTEDMYSKHYSDGSEMNPCFESGDDNGVGITVGGNMLSLVFGDDFVDNSSSTVYSALSRIFAINSLIEDASRLYMLPSDYGENQGRLSSYGEQYGTFQWCHYLKNGPHIKFLSKDLFSDCESLTDFYYEGDGSESDIAWFSSKTGSNVEKITIHVRKGVTIKKKPSNAVLVEDIAGEDVSGTESNTINLPENGVYIFNNKGEFVTSDSWNSVNNDKVVGIALITNNTKALIALNNAKNGQKVVWGPDGFVNGVVATESNYSNAIPGRAESDYDGRGNTNKMLITLSPTEETALYVAASYVFPNGETGYLPALGQLIDAFNNKEAINNALGKVGGIELADDWYWTSTQHYLNYRIWSYGGFDSNNNRWFAQLRNESSNLADIYGAPYILVRPFGDIPNTIKKCAKPTITYQNGKILFSCETEEVEYVYTCTTPASTSQTTSNEFTPSTQYIITVYAKKDGYLDSEPVTQEIDVRGLKGDVNDDGEVDIADAVKIVNLVVGKIDALARPAKEVKDEKVPQ